MSAGPVRTLQAVSRLEARMGVTTHWTPPRWDPLAPERERLRVGAAGLEAALGAVRAAAHARLRAADPLAAVARHRRTRTANLGRAGVRARVHLRRRVADAAARLGAATAALDAGLEAAHRHDRFLRRGARYTWRAIALLGLLAGFAMLRA